MKAMLAAALSAALLTACASSTPAAPAAAAPAATKVAKADKDPNAKICRREVETGHNLPTNVCHTRAEWAAMSKSNQKDVDTFDDSRRTAQGPGN
jgi:hypothetical protein